MFAPPLARSLLTVQNSYIPAKLCEVYVLRINPRCINLFALIITLHLSCLSSYSLADEGASTSLSFAERKVGVINQLRWMNQRLRALRLKLDPSLPLKEEELTQLLQSAQLGMMTGQTFEVALASSRALERQNVDSLKAYLQLLNTLGNALGGLGLSHEGSQRLYQALMLGETTPNQHERLLITLFERARGQLKSKQIDQLWRRYVQQCAQAKRPPSDVAQYVYAKALYFSGDLKRASEVFLRAVNADGYQLRALYFLAVIDLERQDIQAAREKLKRFEAQIITLRSPRAQRSSSAQKPKEDTPDPKIIHTRDNLRVTLIESSPEPSSRLAKKEASPSSLSPELTALLEDFNREELVLLGSAAKRSLRGAPPLRERGAVLDQLSAVINLALARLALLADDHLEAWTRYRQIPVGSPEQFYREGLLEAAYSLKVRGEYLRCAELLNVLIASYQRSEATVSLSLWQAEMLTKAGQTLRATQIYTSLEQMLNKQEIILEGGGGSEVPFSPEVLAWLPEDVAERGRRFSSEVLELQLWLKRGRADLDALTAASRAKKYPLIELSEIQLDRLETQLQLLERRLPKLKQLWRRTSSETPSDKEATLTEVNRGFQQNNERETNRFTADQIAQSIQKLKQRLKAARGEADRRAQTLKKTLQAQLQQEARSLNQHEAKLNQLKEALSSASKLAQRYALQRVKDLKAQLTLGPILKDYWLKEASTATLESSLADRLIELRPLKDLQTQEVSAPTPNSSLDLLPPQHESFIVTPLPDPDRAQRRR